MGNPVTVFDNPIISTEQTQIAVARSEPIDIGGVIGLAFTGIDGAWSAADLAIEVSHDRATWVLASDDTGTVIRMKLIPTGAVWQRPIPKISQIWAYRWMRLVSLNTASTADVNQSAARNIVISKIFDPSSLRR